MHHMLEATAANALANTRGYFARTSADGRKLVFYTGDESRAGTWLEAGSAMLTDGAISRNAFDFICTPNLKG